MTDDATARLLDRFLRGLRVLDPVAVWAHGSLAAWGLPRGAQRPRPHRRTGGGSLPAAHRPRGARAAPAAAGSRATGPQTALQLPDTRDGGRRRTVAPDLGARRPDEAAGHPGHSLRAAHLRARPARHAPGGTPAACSTERAEGLRRQGPEGVLASRRGQGAAVAAGRVGRPGHDHVRAGDGDAAGGATDHQAGGTRPASRARGSPGRRRRHHGTPLRGARTDRPGLAGPPGRTHEKLPGTRHRLLVAAHGTATRA